MPSGYNRIRSHDTLSAICDKIQGTWSGENGEAYEVEESGKEATWTCVRWDSSGSAKKYTLWYDVTSNCIAWGLDWSYYVDASEFLRDSRKLQWYSGFQKSHKPRFTWQCTKPLAAPDTRGSGRSYWKSDHREEEEEKKGTNWKDGTTYCKSDHREEEEKKRTNWKEGRTYWKSDHREEEEKKRTNWKEQATPTWKEQATPTWKEQATPAWKEQATPAWKAAPMRWYPAGMAESAAYPSRRCQGK